MGLSSGTKGIGTLCGKDHEYGVGALVHDNSNDASETSITCFAAHFLRRGK